MHERKQNAPRGAQKIVVRIEGLGCLEVVTSVRESKAKQGTSIRERVANLLRIGNVAQAEELKQEWQHLFIETTPTIVASSTLPAVVRDLELLDEGEDVRALQDILRAGTGAAAQELGRIGSTGYFGRYTHDALREYQTAHGITPVAGYFGPITRAQMKAAGVVGVWW